MFGYSGGRSTSEYLEKYYSEWMKHVGSMHKTAYKILAPLEEMNLPKILRMGKAALGIVYENKKIEACRAASDGDREEMRREIGKLNIYHFLLEGKCLPWGVKREILGNLIEE